MAFMRKMRDAYKTVVWNLKGRNLWTPRLRWEDNIQMDLR